MTNTNGQDVKSLQVPGLVFLHHLRWQKIHNLFSQMQKAMEVLNPQGLDFVMCCHHNFSLLSLQGPKEENISTELPETKFYNISTELPEENTKGIPETPNG